MNALTIEERIQLMKNLLEDPDDFMSFELLRLANQYDQEHDQTENNKEVDQAVM